MKNKYRYHKLVQKKWNIFIKYKFNERREYKSRTIDQRENFVKNIVNGLSPINKNKQNKKLYLKKSTSNTKVI